MALETVCPERIDLIHKNYHKLCDLLVDVDEWGQVTILNMLTRYARTQFIDPNKEVCATQLISYAVCSLLSLIPGITELYKLKHDFMHLISLLLRLLHH